MSLKVLKVSECYESETNPRGANFANAEFNELVASVKEKGVLVPVLARDREGVSANQKYEVVAGNRRLRAAMVAGLQEIPAQVVKMTDSEAREAQIVENLQRADVHPLEEGEAYRQLIEESKLEVVAIAARVGKPESYVKQRLYLTNLEEKPKSAYRSGKINDGHAVLIARLSPGDQTAALKATTERWNNMSVKELKEWIETQIYSPLGDQPWLKSADLFEEVVGKCVECKPERAGLFGDVKSGACTDLKCWRRKMSAYVDHRVKTEKLAKVSVEYGRPAKGTMSRDDYVVVGKGSKGRCDSVRQAIVTEGSKIGELLDICSDKECKTHFNQRSHYSQTPKEQEERRKEREQEEAKREKFDGAVSAALDKVKFPLSEKQLAVLLDIILFDTGTSFLMPICKRHELKADKDKDGSRDYAAPLRRLAEEGGNVGKLRMIVELHLGSYSGWNDGGIDADKKKLLAKL